MGTLERALASSRWVSVVGPPGCGKTLLVRHVLKDRSDIAWVNAAGLRRSEEVLAACLRQLDAEAAPGDSFEGALRRALDGTDTVLVVDGLEVDQEDVGRSLQQMVEATSGVRLAVTARGMSGQPLERVLRLGPLPVPGPRDPLAGPAFDLLANRVAAAGGRAQDLGAHDTAVRRLLRATGGLPLIIEQTAVQIALLGVANAAPVASLASAVQASYELLPPDQQRCFRRLAQVSFPVTIDVLAAVAGVERPAAARLAAGLARASLVEVLPDGRFDMLSPIRQHGAELGVLHGDASVTQRALIGWADRVAPRHTNVGAGDAPWLPDLPAMRAAIAAAAADPGSRDLGYALANRVFSSLYTAMRAREAVEILEGVLVSGDGPGAIGAQVARRAGIAASEVRGTYEGLWLLDRADEHARAADEPALELARTASIRAEMHLDAGDFARAEAEARRAMELDDTGRAIARQATRTLVDVLVSRGELAAAVASAAEIIPTHDGNEERWISLSARTLLGRVALEQGRLAEAEAAARTAVAESRHLAEDRVRLLAETLLRQVDPDAPVSTVDRETLPWAVRLPVLVQDARDLLEAGDAAHAAGLAADVVVLADSSMLARDGVEARMILAHALMAQHDHAQGAHTFLAALERATTMPMPLRAADVLDCLARVAEELDQRESRHLAAAAAEIRAARNAAVWGLAARCRPTPGRVVPQGWVDDGHLTAAGLAEVTQLMTALVQPGAAAEGPSPLDQLTRAERQVADRVADGLTSRQIAEELFVSPRTVDTHLSHIYRKLEINTRARLAAMVVDAR
ncbi:LuxR C-terminal-related transcriptional regulator [Nocardioides solisilvae]|uniref:LuxR C-terminal-related transcriptional regulator n=1 Tax=Nocardioides solisilvae TaxID=1542435 RepID=UPI0013A53158|nr:LuxR C-terminal-related transcriptional regulator [Nocardioides solisilvae]